MTDIRHELTHAILHQNLRFVPLWIDEGLAELLERQHHSATVQPAFHPFGGRLAWDGLHRSTDLSLSNQASQMDEEDYRDSWAGFTI